jgi:hypothetical protein
MPSPDNLMVGRYQLQPDRPQDGAVAFQDEDAGDVSDPRKSPLPMLKHADEPGGAGINVGGAPASVNQAKCPGGPCMVSLLRREPGGPG